MNKIKFITALLITLSFACGRTKKPEIIVQDVSLEEVKNDPAQTKEVLPPPSKLQDTSILKLNDEVTIIAVAEYFKPLEHSIDTCLDEFKNSYICKIDKHSWFGMDRGLELPKTALKSLLFVAKGKSVPLDVSFMFNPKPFSLQLTNKQFSVKKIQNGYELSGYFSDGAGTYEANWQIVNGKGKRTALYNPEY